MRSDLPHSDLAVVGGGVIGLAVAWYARRAGLEVTVLDRGPLGGGTSDAAAGMLAPVSEAEAGQHELLALGLRSAAAWPGLAQELARATGMDTGLRTCGTLLIGRDRDAAEAVDREIALREALGLPVRRLLGSAVRRLEPSLAPSVRLAAELPDDHAVEPRKVVASLIAACTASGVRLHPGTPVTNPKALDADRVVIATGAWSAALGAVPVRPVKGQALRLRDPAGPGLCDRVLRWEPPFAGYLVPRGDGRYYLGASVEERGFDTARTVGAVHELLLEASVLLPGLLELEIEDHLVGLRPGTPDNAPIIGTDPRDERIVWATGHYRNGILLCPATAELVVAELRGERPDHPFRPERFAQVHA